MDVYSIEQTWFEFPFCSTEHLRYTFVILTPSNSQYSIQFLGVEEEEAETLFLLLLCYSVLIWTILLRVGWLGKTFSKSIMMISSRSN